MFYKIIQPIMKTVRMHPLLVTNTREYERNPDRWKSMAFHDIIVESARISLLSQESTIEEPPDSGDIMDIHEVCPKSPFLSFPFSGISGAEKHQNSSSTLLAVTTVTTTTSSTMALGGSMLDKNVDPNIRQNLLNSRAITGNMTPPGNASIGNSIARKAMTPSRLTVIESPPEPAIEATPETTPFVTPVKEDAFRFARAVPTNNVARQLNLDNSPGTRSVQKTRDSFSNTLDNTSPVESFRTNSVTGQTSIMGFLKQENTYLTATTPTSPHKEISPFRFPELLPCHTAAHNLITNNERRDSLFERTDQLVTRMAIQSSAYQGDVENPTTVPSKMIPCNSDVPPPSSITAASVNDSVPGGKKTENCETSHKFLSDETSTHDSGIVLLSAAMPNTEKIPTEHKDRITSALGPEGINNNEYLASVQQKEISSLAQYRPSPVKFTNQRPEQFPVKPKPERMPLVPKTDDSRNSIVTSSANTDNKICDEPETQRPMLSLETLKDFTDFGKEEVKISLSEFYIFSLFLTCCLNINRLL